MLEINLLSIGFHKGEPDYRASLLVQDMTYGQMQEFRAMITVAVAAAEGIWHRKNVPDHLQAMQAKQIDN